MKRLVYSMLPILFTACETTEPGMPNGTGFMQHDWTMMGYGWGGILFWVFIIAMIIILFGMLQNQGRGTFTTPTSHETPLEILKKRYARGDISKEEFDRMKKDIM